MCLKLFLGTDAAAETLGEAINTATGIHHFLLAGVEGVAQAAHVNVEVLGQGRASFESIAAAAVNNYVGVFGMNFGFHDIRLAFLRRHPNLNLPGTAQRLVEWLV
jgi:hypothetical protein